MHNFAGFLESYAAKIDGMVYFNLSTESVNAALCYCSAANSTVCQTVPSFLDAPFPCVFPK
jgi:hypothetical protein